MRRSALPLVYSLVATTLLVGCFGRPNPRVTKVVRDPGDSEAPSRELSFSYDSSNRVSDVERSEGDESRAWALTWDGTVLTKVVVQNEFAGTIDESTTELEYENGRLVGASTESEADNRTATFGYDDQGRLASFDSTGDDSESSGTIDYDADGQIEALRGENTADDVTTSSAVELERADNRLASFTLSQEGNDDQAFESTFDEETGRLSEIRFESEGDVGGQPAIITGIMSYSYDEQGRLEQVEQTAETGQLDIDVATFELSYDDGDASALDLAPNEVFLFGIFFDLKGNSHGTLDNTTTVPRLAFQSW